MPTSIAFDAADPIDAKLARRLIDKHPLEAAQSLEGLEHQQVVDILQGVPLAAAALVLESLERSFAADCLARWPGEQRSQLVESLGAALAARLLRCLSTSAREEILAGCPVHVADPVRRLTRYPEGSAGALMDPDPPAAPQDATVAQARTLLASSSGRTRGYLFVVTRQDVLVGVIEIDELLGAPANSALGSLARPATARIAARADEAAVVLHPGWRQHHVLPVVDRNEVLVGAIDHRIVHEGDPASESTETPLGLAIGEMYWALLSTLVEGVVRAVRRRTPESAAATERDAKAEATR